jgi:hypothetical protein
VRISGAALECGLRSPTTIEGNPDIHAWKSFKSPFDVIAITRKRERSGTLDPKRDPSPHTRDIANFRSEFQIRAAPHSNPHPDGSDF